MKVVQEFESIVLDDLPKLFKKKEYLIELLLREYDLLHYLEESLLKLENPLENKLKKSLLKDIGLCKQKLIFYTSHIKSNFNS
jgi:hypothetical protein